MCQIPVRGARQSPLTDFSSKLGPFLVRLTPQKWAMSKLTTIFRLNIIVNDQNETYQDKGIASILTKTIASIYQMFQMLYVVGFTLA